MSGSALYIMELPIQRSPRRAEARPVTVSGEHMSTIARTAADINTNFIAHASELPRFDPVQTLGSLVNASPAPTYNKVGALT